MSYGKGWKPDLPDFRDRPFSMAMHAPAMHFVPPVSVDLRSKCPPVYDQGALGSCTGNGIAAAVDFERGRQGLTFMTPSRLFIYFNERSMEGTISSDAGAMIRDGIKSVARMGVCPETDWPYDVSKYTVLPPENCYTDALKFRALDYWRVPRDMLQFRGCLAAGFPVVLGFSVYETFETDAVAKDGRVPVPAADENLLGGHCVLAVGYDDSMPQLASNGKLGCLICRNSWGSGWGDAGYFYLPYEFILNPDLSDDFWTIKAES